MANPNLALQSNETFNVPMNSIFGVAYYIDTQSDLNPESIIMGSYNWYEDKKLRIGDEFDNKVMNSDSAKWSFPFSGSTVVQKIPNTTTQVFQLALRSLTNTRPNGIINKMNYVNYIVRVFKEINALIWSILRRK